MKGAVALLGGAGEVFEGWRCRVARGFLEGAEERVGERGVRGWENMGLGCCPCICKLGCCCAAYMEGERGVAGCCKLAIWNPEFMGVKQSAEDNPPSDRLGDENAPKFALACVKFVCCKRLPCKNPPETSELQLSSLRSFSLVFPLKFTGEQSPLGPCSLRISANSSKSAFANSETAVLGFCVSRLTTRSRCEP